MWGQPLSWTPVATSPRWYLFSLENSCESFAECTGKLRAKLWNSHSPERAPPSTATASPPAAGAAFPWDLVRGEGFTIFSQSSWRFPPAPPGKFLHTHCSLPRSPWEGPRVGTADGTGEAEAGRNLPFCGAGRMRKCKRDAGAPHRFPIGAPRREEAARSRPQRQEPGSSLGGLQRWDSPARGGAPIWPSTPPSREQPAPRAAAGAAPVRGRRRRGAPAGEPADTGRGGKHPRGDPGLPAALGVHGRGCPPAPVSAEGGGAAPRRLGKKIYQGIFTLQLLLKI